MADEDIRKATAAFLAAQEANRRLMARGRASGQAISDPIKAPGAPEAYGQEQGDLFPPGIPLWTDQPQPVRYIDFPVNLNALITPRANEAFGFPQLRSFANIELVRLAIETRKQQIEALDWGVRLKKPGKGSDGLSTAAEKTMRFLERPDGDHQFATWMRMLLEDMLVIDAPTIEIQRTRGGDAVALLLVPGDTIHPMLDQSGRRPTGKGITAYQQVIKGKVWVNLDDTQLIYTPRNPRPGKIYGFSPVEQIIVTIQTILARQAGQLGYFTDGNIPAGILTGPEGWTPGQLMEMQDAFNVLMKGDPNHKSNLIWTPFGTKYQAFKEAPLKNDFDEWLARIVTYAFNLPPTPFIRQMNRSTAHSDSERGAEEGLMPIKLWIKRLLDSIIANVLGHPELEFIWADKTEVDLEQQAKVDDFYIKNGSTTINEVRDRRGLLPIDGGDVPLVWSPSGVIPLETLLEAPVVPTQGAGNQGQQQPVTQAKPAKSQPGAKTPAKTPAAAKQPAKETA